MPTFTHRFAGALEASGFTTTDLFHRAGVRPERLRQLGLGEGMPINFAEASLLGEVLLLDPHELIAWCATPASGPLHERLVHHPFLGLVGPMRQLNLHQPPSVPTPAALACATGWAIVDTAEMAGAGVELGSRIAVRACRAEALVSGAIAIAQNASGTHLRRYLHAPGDPALLVAEPAQGLPPLPMQMHEATVVGVVALVRRPDLELK